MIFQDCFFSESVKKWMRTRGCDQPRLDTGQKKWKTPAVAHCVFTVLNSNGSGLPKTFVFRRIGKGDKLKFININVVLWL